MLIDRITNFLAYIAGGVLLILMLLVTADVLGRHFFSTPVWGTFEFSSMMLATIVGLGFAYTHRQKSNFSVTLFVSYLPPSLRYCADIIYSVIGLCLMIIIVWEFILYIIDNAKRGSLLGVLNIPVWPWQIPLSFGYAFLGVILIYEAIVLARMLGRRGYFEEEGK